MSQTQRCFYFIAASISTPPAWNYTARKLWLFYHLCWLSCNYVVGCGLEIESNSSSTPSYLVVSSHRKPSAPFLVTHCGDKVKCVLAPLHQNPQGFHKPLVSSLCALFLFDSIQQVSTCIFISLRNSLSATSLQKCAHTAIAGYAFLAMR